MKLSRYINPEGADEVWTIPMLIDGEYREIVYRKNGDRYELDETTADGFEIHG